MKHTILTSANHSFAIINSCQGNWFCDSFECSWYLPLTIPPITTMTDDKTSTLASEKLESSQAHAKKALDATTAAAREVAEAAKNSARGAYSTSREELGAAAQDLKEAARSTYDDLSQTAKEKYGDLSEKARARYADVADLTSNAAQEYKTQFEDIAVQAEDYVRDNPFKAVGIVFAAGIVLGLLLRRR
jgi:ElaB/YqjD/DUF883 family membrane-anchored ribosome-binding protein